jgi:hypothetical protein
MLERSVIVSEILYGRAWERGWSQERIHDVIIEKVKKEELE